MHIYKNYTYVYIEYTYVCVYIVCIVVLHKIRDQTRGGAADRARAAARNPASPQHKNWAATSHNPTVLLAIAQGQKSLENGGSGQPICP